MTLPLEQEFQRQLELSQAEVRDLQRTIAHLRLELDKTHLDIQAAAQQATVVGANEIAHLKTTISSLRDDGSKGRAASAARIFSPASANEAGNDGR